ncbi:MAG TPA: DUF4388 domain-containing protein [Acidimicrobiales bacterium]|nr:DUF4388 domain-containing protein [Acidimicrobiales bacterium]
MALNGSLDDYSPAGALRVLSSSGRTGAVRFTGVGGCTAYLCDGQLYFARGEDTDEALAAALVRPGRLTAEAWTAAVEEAGDSPRVGELLIAHGAIDPDLLASVVLSVIYDPLITLFREADGAFDFEPDTLHWIGPYRSFNVEAIVNEVRRRVRNVDEMQDVIPSTATWVAANRTLPDGAAQVTLLREDWELVTSLSGPRTVRELAASMGRGQYSTAQVVHRLARAGLLEVATEPFGTLEDDPVHEPSAAARLAAAEAGDPPTGIVDPRGLDEDGPGDAPRDLDDADAPAPGPRATDPAGADTAPSPEGAADDRLPAAERTEGLPPDDLGPPRPNPDEEPIWAAAWGAPGNPFEHAPTDPADDLGVTFGPRLEGVGAGPEMPPLDDGDMLPRRSSVREAEPTSWWRDEGLSDLGPEAPGGVTDDLGTGLAGISGFQDPTADAHREDPALAEATDGGPRLDPNAAWLENLYAQFIDEAEEPATSRSRKREALDVAFQSGEAQETERTGTLRRLVDALRRV